MSIFGFTKKKETAGKKKFEKIFFATDIHGSVTTYHKLLNSAKIYKTNKIILGGDITGKLVVPVIKDADGSRRVTLHEQRINVGSEQEYQKVLANLELLGYYYTEMTAGEFKQIQKEEKKIHEIFVRLQKERLDNWATLADQRFKGTDVRLYVTGGNDDDAEVMSFVGEMETENFVACEGKIIPIGELHTMVSLGISNPTPWQTPREYPEEVVAEKIKDAVKGIDDFRNVIFNFHVPPYDSTLDLCPKLDSSTEPPTPVTSGGQLVFAPAGSHAVKGAILKYQPLLVLCGHIHEARGVIKMGRTTVVNPGSEYGEGVLRGVIVNLSDGKVASWQFTAG